MRTRRFSSSPAARPSRQKLTNEASSPPQLLAMSHIFCWTQGALKTTEGKAEVPSLDKEGWLHPLRKCREASFAGADGVVGSSHRLSEVERTTPFLMFRPTGLTLRAAPPKERDHLFDGTASIHIHWNRLRLQQCVALGSRNVRGSSDVARNIKRGTAHIQNAVHAQDKRDQRRI